MWICISSEDETSPLTLRPLLEDWKNKWVWQHWVLRKGKCVAPLWIGGQVATTVVVIVVVDCILTDISRLMWNKRTKSGLAINSLIYLQSLNMVNWCHHHHHPPGGDLLFSWVTHLRTVTSSHTWFCISLISTTHIARLPLCSRMAFPASHIRLFTCSCGKNILKMFCNRKIKNRYDDWGPKSREWGDTVLEWRDAKETMWRKCGQKRNWCEKETAHQVFWKKLRIATLRGSGKCSAGKIMQSRGSHLGAW